MEPQQQSLSTIDERVVVESRPIRETKKSLMTIKCAGCGLVLAYSNNEERGVRLAVTNSSARPCCDLWRTNLELGEA